MDVVAEVTGWIGTLLIVTAYILVSSEKLSGGSRIYQVMNLLGAIGVGVNVVHQQAWPAVALQVMWGAIAVVALLRALPLWRSAKQAE